MPKYKVTVELELGREFEKEWEVAEAVCNYLRAICFFKIKKIEPVKSE